MQRVGPERRTFLSPFSGFSGSPLFRPTSLIILLVAFAIRVYHLGRVGLDYDEAFAFHAATMNVSGILYLVSTAEPHPPLYYTLLHFWYPLAGTSEFALRMPSLIANVLTVIFLVKIGEICGGRSVGLAAAALFAVNPFQIWFAQDARMYAPVALFGAAAVYSALRVVRNREPRFCVAYGIWILLALYTHYYAIFLALFIVLFVLADALAQRASRRYLLWWVGTQVVVGMLYLPWLVYARQVSIDYNSRAPVTTAYMLGVIRESLADYSLGTSLPIQTASALSDFFLAILVIGALALVGRRAKAFVWRRALLMGGYLLLPLLLGFGVSYFRSMFQPRYFMVSAPAFFLLLGFGASTLVRRVWPVGVFATVFLFVTQAISVHNYFVDPQYNKSEVGEAINYVGQHIQAGDGVILDGWSPSTQFWYYNDIRGTEPVPADILPFGGPNGWDLTFPRIDETMAIHRGVWLLTYGVLEVDSQHSIESYLAKNYYQVFIEPIISNHVYYYASAPPVAPSITPIGAVCDGVLSLKDVESYASSVRAGDTVPLALRMQALSATPRDYVVSWRLFDTQGHTVLQRDSEPASGFAPTSTWTPGEDVLDRYGMLLPSVLLPGQYHLGVVVFDRATGAICSFQQDGQPLPGMTVPLTSITVLPTSPRIAVDDPVPGHSADTTFGGLTLHGYDLDRGPYQPGGVVTLRLFWQVTGAVTGDDSVAVRLLDSRGSPVVTQSTRLGGADFPTSQWEPGRSVVTYSDLTIPPRASTGQYHFSLTVTGPGEPAVESINTPNLSVVASPRNFTIPAIPHPRVADFGGEIDLLGYGIQSPVPRVVEPGQPLDLTLYWRDQRPVGDNYKVFTHLVGPNGKIYGQVDSIPLAGKAPTTSWVPGQVLTDRYRLDVSAGAPPGQYQLVVGFYDPLSGARVPLTSTRGDSFVVTTVNVAT